MNVRVNRLLVVSLSVTLFAITCMLADARGGSDKTEPPTVASKKLAADYVKDKNAAEKKYGDRYNPKELIVEGVVVRFEKNNFGKIARLEGSGKVTISCLIRSADEESVKMGEKVAIRGRCRGLYDEGKDQIVDINGGVVVKAK